MIRKHVSETLQVAEDHVMTKAPQEHAKWQIHRRQVLFSATRSVLSQPNISFQLVIHFFEFSFICIRRFAVRHSNFKFECSLTSQSHISQRKLSISFQLVTNYFDLHGILSHASCNASLTF